MANRDSVDPLAEAEVLIAYGRNRRAIELLENAVRANPSRQDLQARLDELKNPAAPDSSRVTGPSEALKLRLWMILSPILAAVSLWGVAHYAAAVFNAHRAVGWPVTEGTVAFSAAVRGCGRGDSVFPQVVYRYTVNGEDFMSEQIAFGAVGCGWPDYAQSTAARFPLGSSVRVHYDAEDPHRAVLLAGEVLFDTWLGLAGSSLGLFAGVYLYLKSKEGLERLAEE